MAQPREFNLQNFVISVVIVGITLVLGIYITDTISLQIDAPNTVNTVVNESLGSVSSGSSHTVAGASAPDFAGFVLTSLRLTNGTSVPFSNYTVNNATGTITSKAGAGPFNNAVWLASYHNTFTNQTAASSAANSVTEALATGTAWISILVVVGFATIILSMLTSGLGSAARASEVPYY